MYGAVAYGVPEGLSLGHGRTVVTYQRSSIDQLRNK